MNITGKILGCNEEDAYPGAEGAFYRDRMSSGGKGGFHDYNISFDASRTWTGSTNSTGSHTHSLSIDATGGGKGHTHSLTGESHSHKINLPLPPFFKLAFFVKLPE